MDMDKDRHVFLRNAARMCHRRDALPPLSAPCFCRASAEATRAPRLSQAWLLLGIVPRRCDGVQPVATQTLRALQARRRMKRWIMDLKPSKGFLGVWLLLLAIWIGANSTFAVESALVGALISGVLAFAFTRHAGAWHDFRLTPSRVYHFLLYTGIFFVELVRANINMLRYVYSPRINIASRHRQDQDRPEIADRPAGACQFDRADAWLARHGHQGRHPVHPLARCQDDGSGRGDPDDRRPVREASGEVFG